MKVTNTAVRSIFGLAFAGFNSVSAFAPTYTRSLKRAPHAFVSSSSFKHSQQRFLSSNNTLKMAKVSKLNEPASFLEGVDVFIFDCDGVIWRVRSVLNDLCFFFIHLSDL